MPSPRRPLSVLHTADVHLGSDGYGSPDAQAAYRQRYRIAFERVVDRALADRVDLVLIAGDLFDHNRVPDEEIEFARVQLDRISSPVVVLPGNHDVLCAGAIYERQSIGAPGSHVRVIRRLGGEIVDLPDLDACVWGRAMDEHTPAFRPLDHLPGRDRQRWCLAMAHGFFYPEGERPERSSPILAGEIRASGWDYVALGHQHVQTDVSQGAVAAHYPGAPVIEWDRGAAPTGSVLRIEFSEQHGVRVEPRPLF